MTEKTMKLFIWAGGTQGNGYDKPSQSVKIYAVAHDEGEARRQLDKILDSPAVKNGAILREVLRTARPQVFQCPVAEINISDGKKAMAIISAGEEG